MAKRIGEANASLLVKTKSNFEDHKKATTDFVSQVTVYGNQQRTRNGYKPKKPGRKSFHALFCFS